MSDLRARQNSDPGPKVEEATWQGPDPIRRPPAYPSEGFIPNTLLAHRYRIVRFIAKGGMGEVYEAEDVELGERIALKSIRPEFAQDDASADRFKREVQMARKVTHPNVCRLFELGYHPSAGDPQRFLFLTMELLGGETLMDKIRRDGPFSEAEALPIARQMALALEAAHDAGVIHRDFKSSNVMLVPAEGGSRVVITDFGLARSSAANDGKSLFGAGFVGTPSYMAPEQVDGRPLTPAADIYSFGMVLYEMVTGRCAFVADTPLMTAVMRLRADVPPPRSFVPGLDSRWEAAILRCLEREPHQRCQRAVEALAILEGVPVPARSLKSRLRGRGALLAAALLIAAASLGLGLYFLGPGARTGAIEVPRPKPGLRTIAVMGFKNLAARPEGEWISNALGEMLGSKLAMGGKFGLIPGESVAQAKSSLHLSVEDSYAPETLSRLRQALGTDYVILGSYLDQGNAEPITVMVKIQDVSTGGIVASLTERAPQKDLFDLCARISESLVQKLLLAPRPGEAARASSGAGQPAGSYDEGLARLRSEEFMAARQAFEKSVASEPKNPLFYAALAWTDWKLGFESDARDGAEVAFKLGGSLPKEERLLVEARYREIFGPLEQAADIYETLFNFYPGNLDYGLSLLRVQTLQGEEEEASKTLASLQAQAGASEEARIDLEGAALAQAMSSSKLQLELARSAATKAGEQQLRFLLARARLLEGSALSELGQFPEADAAFTEAGSIYQQGRDRAAASLCDLGKGTVLLRQGKLDGARLLFEQALSAAQELGWSWGAAEARRRMADACLQSGDLKQARQNLDEALKLRKSFSGEVEGGMDQLRLGETFLLSGALAPAREQGTAALRIGERLADEDLLLAANHFLAWLALEAGNLEEAQGFNEQELALVEPRQDLLDKARAQLLNAEIALGKGDLSQCETMAREALSTFEQTKRVVEEVDALSILVPLLLERGRADDAKATAARAEALAAELQQTLPRIHVARMVGLVADLGPEQERNRAARELEAAIGAAQGKGLVREALELRLVLGRLEKARPRLEQVRHEAEAKGFQLLASRAANAAAKLKK